MVTLRNTAWKHGYNKVESNRLFAYEGGMGLAKGKAATEKILDNETISLKFASFEAAQDIVAKFKAINAEAHIQVEDDETNFN